MVKGGLVSLFTIGVLAAPGAGAAQPASMVARLDASQLVARSQVVVYGRVTAVRSAGAISEASVAVECAMKGAPGKQLIVTFSPGQSESPAFHRDEAVLLFLTEVGAGRYQATGGAQGKFSFGKAASAHSADPPDSE